MRTFATVHILTLLSLAPLTAEQNATRPHVVLSGTHTHMTHAVCHRVTSRQDWTKLWLEHVGDKQSYRSRIEKGPPVWEDYHRFGARLETSLSCETNSATREATVWFTWQIENTGDKPAHLLNHFAYASRGPLLSLQFVASGQKAVTVELDMRDCVTWGMQDTKIRTLDPKETFNLKARANLKAFGPLVPGQYTVFIRYEPKFWAREMMTDEIQKKHDLTPDDLWQGRLKSNEIKLTIKE